MRGSGYIVGMHVHRFVAVLQPEAETKGGGTKTREQEWNVFEIHENRTYMALVVPEHREKTMHSNNSNIMFAWTLYTPNGRCNAPHGATTLGTMPSIKLKKKRASK